MLIAIVKITNGNIIKNRCNINQIEKAFKYGLSIAILFFAQKLVSTLILGMLGASSVNVAVFHIISIASMMLTLVSNAAFTNIFIKIVRKEQGLFSVALISGFNSLVVYLLCCMIFSLAVNNSTFTLFNDVSLLKLLRENIFFAFVYFLFDILMTASLIISRAYGDTWRCQITWCLGMLVFY